MKVLAISHSAVAAPYRRRWHLLAAMPDVRLALVAPRWWLEANRRVECVPTPDDRGLLIRSQPLTWGLRSPALRNVCHVYPHAARIVRAFRPDILEVWEEPFTAAAAHWIATARAIRPRVKVVFFSAQNAQRRWPPPFSRFEAATYRAADHAFPVTAAVADVLRAKGYRGPQTVLPLGVDAAVFAPRHFRDDGRPLVIGCIGKLNEQKGVADLVEAFACLAGRHRLRLIGSGPAEGALRRRIAQLPAAGRIELLPAVPHERVAGEMGRLDVFVMPSRSRGVAPEQFGRAAAEAMSGGLPVIVSDAGQLPDTVGRAGLIFAAGDVPALVRQLRRVSESPRLRRTLGAAARDRATAEFSWESIARRQHEAYCGLMGVRRPAEPMPCLDECVAELLASKALKPVALKPMAAARRAEGFVEV
jgi:glycosyltransferase involved in cell wall biosynthesis